MCNKCNTKTINYYNNYTNKPNKKDQSSMYILFGCSVAANLLGTILNGSYNFNTSSVSGYNNSFLDVIGGVVKDLFKSNKKVNNETNIDKNKKTTEDQKINIEKELKTLLGDDVFNKLDNDIKTKVLTKYTVYKEILNLEGENLKSRIIIYIDALNAHAKELEFGKYAESINRAAPNYEELVNECPIKIENKSIDETLNNYYKDRSDSNYEKYVTALKNRGLGYIDLYDKNNDEKISFDEFKALEKVDLGEKLLEEDDSLLEEIARPHFNRIDKNGDNVIDTKEMASHLFALSRYSDDDNSPNNTVAEISFEEWHLATGDLTISDQEIAKNVSARYNNIYNKLYDRLK